MTTKSQDDPEIGFSEQTIKATSTQDLDPRPLLNNDPNNQLYELEPGEIPSNTLTWKLLGFLNHI